MNKTKKYICKTKNILNEHIVTMTNCDKFNVDSIFVVRIIICSESAKMDSKPTSWPRSQIESHVTKTSREKRKLQSSSPSSRNHPASVRHMKRFQKSTAIYTLPIRGKQQHTGTHCKTGKCLLERKKKLKENCECSSIFDSPFTRKWVIFTILITM